MATQSITNTSRIPMQPWIPSEAAQRVCQGVFSPSSAAVGQDQSGFTYSTVNDFGKVIHKLLFSTPYQGFSSYFFENIKEIGDREGFEVQYPKSTQIYSVRDPKLCTADGHVLKPNCSDHTKVAVYTRGLHALHQKDHPVVLSDHPSFVSSTVGSVGANKLDRRTVDGLKNELLRDSKLYFEGGNTFYVTDRNKNSRYIIGDDLPFMTHHILRMENAFIPELIEKKAEEISRSLNDAAIKSVLLEMLAMGLLADSSILRYRMDRSMLREILRRGGLQNISDLNNYTHFDLEGNKIKGRNIATKYLAQMEFVHKELFPKELCCDADKVTFVPQPAYHLDLMMAPGRNGSFFVQDYNLAVQLLQAVKENKDSLNLCETDLTQLEQFIEVTEKLGEQLTPLLEKIKEKLADAEFTVIPTPGAFFGWEANADKKPLNINFLNCVTGFSPQNNHYYYITSGAQTSGILGDVLMDAYAEFIHTHCGEDTAVYFAGRNPENDKDFSEAMLDSSTRHLGPHCLSYETRDIRS